MNWKENILIGSTACAVIVAALGFAWWYRTNLRPDAPAAVAAVDQSQMQGQTQNQSAEQSVPPPLATSTPVTATAAEPGHRVYTSSPFHFSLVYPDNLQVEEYKEASDALTVSFQDPDTNEGFEVYITPYAQDQITSARFALDEPSGVYDDPQNIIVDGVRATMFYGSNSIMGDTREVWFIRGGFLYEVATYKELDAWLSQIMATWKFN